MERTNDGRGSRARPHRLIATGALLLALGLIVPSGAHAAVDARLDGKAVLKANVKRDAFDPKAKGSIGKRDWNFTPLCDEGVCDRVKLVREGSDSKVKYTLKRKGKGVWKGSKKIDGGYSCGNEKWKGKGTDKVKVTVDSAFKSGPKAGNASKISAEVGITFVKFTGAKSKECQKAFKKLGIKKGERPKSAFTYAGKF